MISTILWDMDGVLVETSETHYHSWVVAFAHFGFTFSREYFHRFYGMNNESTIRGILGDTTPLQLIRNIGDFKENWFRKHIRSEIRLLPGVYDWLKMFAERKYKQAVASSGPQENIELIVSATRTGSFFKYLISCANKPSKPDPWVFQEAASRLHSTPDECVVIEDTPNGIMAAKAAGMNCIAVCSSNPRNALEKADLIVKDLSQLDTTTFDETFY